MASLTGLRATAGRKSLVAFGLVRVDVAMAPMYDSKADSRPTRNQVCPDHKEKVKQRWYCEEGDHAVEPVKAVEYEGQFVVTDESEWKALEAESTGEVSLKAWVEGLNPRTIEQSYFLWPDNPASSEGFMLLQHLLLEHGGYLIGVSPGEHGTTKVFAIGGDAVGLVAFSCRHEAYFRVAHAEKLLDAETKYKKPSAETLKLATELLSQLPNEFDAASVTDTLGERQWEYVARKAAGKKLKEVKDAEVEVADLQASLRASLAAVQQANQQAKKKKAPSKRTAKVA